ncbi:MAG: ACT domain-containing protein [Oscillospiraceae bacterium]|nr:ACT domain-containing protein [Oscillospiraceae bacterium]
MTTIKQLSVFVQNQPGALAAVTDLLAKKNIDIRALSLAESADYGILRMIVTDPDTALEALQSENCLVKLTPVLAVVMDDAPGGMNATVKCLSDAGVSIEYAYAFILRKTDRACVIMRVNDLDKAIAALNAADTVGVLKEDELWGL